MASVTSLDQDMRNLRLSRYTPQAANEARTWIESTLGEKLPSGDLLEGLKDGVALCKLANLAVQGKAGSIKFKASPMPFIQMENISHFLKACEMPPLNMPAHDRFLTVDLYEQKDPAQVLQCLGAFSRQAHNLNPSRFSSTIGPKKAGGTMSPATTGGGYTNGGSMRRAPSPTKPSVAMPTSTCAMSPALTGGSNSSRQSATKSPEGPVSSWSNRADETKTAPAWNIHQYGYMGGASQGNQGISFGARRQITSQAPAVPSLAEKQKLRKQKEEEEERARQQAAEERERRAREVQQAEERARLDEERRWEEETKRNREEERQRLEQQKREWEEQERKWREEEQQQEFRRREDAELQAKMSVRKPPEKPRVPSSSILRGQTLSQWQKEQAALSAVTDGSPESTETPEQRRVRELEKQLEEARERERQYQAEREERLRKGTSESGSRPSTADTARPGSAQQSDVSWAGDEREFSRKQLHTDPPAPRPAQVGAQRPLPTKPEAAPSLPSRPLPEPAVSTPPPSLPARGQPSPFTRPLPTPKHEPEPEPQPEPEIFEQRQPNRTEAFLASNPAPATTGPRISSSQEAGDTSLEQQRLRDSRVASQQKTKAGGWASKSLLEREMERERERQKEWEANQEATKSAPRDASQGTGEGQTWDVNQYGYMGGDSMNKGSSVGSGINIGGRRQIIGPRPQK
ncbi:Transgelin [Pseudocercospora fuligena]|uniref:Transgelin n=1 Tax=Pseudocercospora fuligena TaxID=685502 RepID=A0A8H6VFX7_9PEZI|nr:Transgelin [Pseudocercospora fuligena]